MNENNLMVFAENKFLLRTEKEQWNSPTTRDEKIIAQTAQVDALEKGKPAQNSNNTSSPNKWAWQAVCLKESGQKKKAAKGKTHQWCPSHDAWTIHSPEQCEGKRGKAAEKAAEDTPYKSLKELQLSQALQAVINESHDEDHDSEATHG
jgi:hypothetical protein